MSISKSVYVDFNPDGQNKYLILKSFSMFLTINTTKKSDLACIIISGKSEYSSKMIRNKRTSKLSKFIYLQPFRQK